MMPVTNPKGWEAVTGFTGNIKAAVERQFEKATSNGGFFPFWPGFTRPVLPVRRC